MSVSSDLLRENSRDLLREEEPCDDEIESPINDDDESFPTTSIRVVLVDSDPNFLRVTKNLMTEFSYQVTVFINGDEAMAFLMKNKHEIDLVIWDFNVADINGLEALNTIGKEMDLPVAIMSHDSRKETVMKSTKNGACHFLVKPVSKEVTAVLWQHVYRKRMSKSGLDPVESDREEDFGLGKDDLSQSNEEGSKNVDDSGEQNTFHQKGDKCKKQRIIWTPELHHKFEKAIEHIGGLEKAVPKQILKYMQENMNVEGLTRNNVASHLQRLRWQKYRQNAERKQSVPQETREDSVWRNDGPSTSLAASKPLLNSSFINHHSRVPYFTNGQAAANSPMQYPSNSYLTMNNNHFMTNPLANLAYTDSLHQPQQPQQYLHQQYYHSSLPSPSVIIKQESSYASAATETPDLISNQNSPFMDLGEFFPPGLSKFDPNNRY